MPGNDPARRLRSIDVVRGVVMVLMAIDHVRVYAGVPAGGPTPAIFFTRWITNFCAPAFVFFAGTGAFLYGRALGDARGLARFLLGRGAMLVVLELTLIRFFWTFNLDYSNFALAGVIWMLGWCMVLLATLVCFTPRTVGIAGVLIIVLQQLFGALPRLLPATVRDPVAVAWNFIYPAGGPEWEAISILYTIVPWIGVMAAGYGFGTILTRDAEARDRWCLRVGLSATALFLVIGSVIVASSYQSPGPPLWARLLNQQKYPASQLFLLMTLGPVVAFLPLAERARGWIAGAFATFGRVPMFYYLLHIPLIHVSALLVYFLRDGQANASWFATAPYASVPAQARWNLGLLYLVFAAVVVLLYWPCRWYAGLKARRRDRWLRYM